MSRPPAPARPSLPATLWLTLRPPFLLLTLSCVALGMACAARVPAVALAPAEMVVVLLGALCAHASVNALNEWHDWRSGLDAITQRTPFSGGSGALPSHPAAAPAVLGLGLLLLALAGGTGLWLLLRQGPALLPIGLAGLVLVVAYTPWITRHPWICLLAPGLGLGPLMVVGSQLALTGRHSALAWLASLVPGCLASGLLLLNQFPDVDADRRAGRRHLPLLWGRPRAARAFAVLLAAALAVMAVGGLVGVLPVSAVLLAALAAPPSGWLAHRVLGHADDLPGLRGAMALNVALCLALPLLLAGLIWLG